MLLFPGSQLPAQMGSGVRALVKRYPSQARNETSSEKLGGGMVFLLQEWYYWTPGPKQAYIHPSNPELDHLWRGAF